MVLEKLMTSIFISETLVSAYKSMQHYNPEGNINNIIIFLFVLNVADGKNINICGLNAGKFQLVY
jgi:hypothetical protein